MHVERSGSRFSVGAAEARIFLYAAEIAPAPGAVSREHRRTQSRLRAVALGWLI